MKALTVKQPWAHLIAAGAKRWETRSWSTNYRGLLAIHASKDMGTVDAVLVKNPGENPVQPEYQHPFYRYLPSDWNGLYGDICYGGIEAIVEIQDCQPAERVAQSLKAMVANDDLHHDIRRMASEELRFGNFEAGQWAWQLALHVNVSGRCCGLVRGRQGLWNLPNAALRALRAGCRASDIPWPKAQGAK